jgi:hypothetical protein
VLCNFPSFCLFLGRYFFQVSAGLPSLLVMATLRRLVVLLFSFSFDGLALMTVG